MPAEVKIIVQGDTNVGSSAENGEEHTQPTITLVRDGGLVMVVDPGILPSQQVLIDALAKENLTVNDVNIVCITHSHLDHYRNIGMFPTAKTLEYFGMWNGDTVVTWSENVTENIHVFHTPGHDYSGITLFVDTKDGVVAICGDVFWQESYPLEPSDDAYASNPDKLKESREMILEKADWIIPGHGKMYKISKGGDVDNDSGIEVPVRKTGSGISVICKSCGKEMKQKDKCQCRPYICFKCCECGLDCDLCNCSHKKENE